MRVALDYSRSVLSGLSLTEWTDALNFDNIPRALLDGSYHLEFTTASNTREDHDNVHIVSPINIRIFQSGFIDTVAARDSVLDRAEDIIEGMVFGVTRLNYSGIKDCVFESLEVGPVAISNDNVFIARVGFNILVIKSTR
jgi:hypothetical protein